MLNRRRFIGVGVSSLAMGAMPARADLPRLRIGLQEGGTGQWEIAAMTALGLPEEYGFALELRRLADSPAGQVALKTGTVDIILTDLVWVSVERFHGGDATIVPFSLATGGVMVPSDRHRDITGLSGASIGIGGGPLDKSWLFLQAYYAAKTGRQLKDDAKPRFGAAPLINELLFRGQLGAALNFWQWNIKAQLAGARPLITVAQMLAELGVGTPPPLLGWTFSDSAANAAPELYSAFFRASTETKKALLTDNGIWDTVRRLMGADDDRLFAALRDGFRVGIPQGPLDPANAAAAYGLLARFGGDDLVQGATSISEGTWWREQS